MSEGPEKELCFSCGALAPKADGPTHDYMLSSPGCWAIYGEVTVADVHETDDPESHRAAVQRWARSAWDAWSVHHEAVNLRVESLA